MIFYSLFSQSIGQIHQICWQNKSRNSESLHNVAKIFLFAKFKKPNFAPRNLSLLSLHCCFFNCNGKGTYKVQNTKIKKNMEASLPSKKINNKSLGINLSGLFWVSIVQKYPVLGRGGHNLAYLLNISLHVLMTQSDTTANICTSYHFCYHH